MVPQVALAKSVVCRPAAHAFHQNVGHRGKPQPQLVGPHRRGRSAVGEQIDLTLLDAVLHLAARAIDCLVELSTIAVPVCQ